MAQGSKTGGRQKGTPNKTTAKLQVEIAESGETPLAYMLRVMRDPTVEHSRRDDMAKAASPYSHAKLASIEHKGGLELTTQTKEQRDAAIAAAARADR